MKKRLTIALAFFALTQTCLGQYCPPNIDFEFGNFDNWQCSIGRVSSANGFNEITLTPSPPTRGRHEIITDVTARDRYGGFPELCPYGGTYSVKLGNDGIGAQAEGLSYTFQVPPTEDTFSFTYFYAVVFEDPSHLPKDQPRFFVSAYDVQTGAIINCASYNYVASGNIPGFKISTVSRDVLYKEWSPSSIQFAGLAGRTIRLEFKTADCTLGGHFGYAYIDVGSNCSNILATAPYCVETNSVILNAPYGFQSYTWYNEDFTVVVGHQQSITLSPPPATSGVYYVDVVPYPGYGCRDTAKAVITPLPIPDTPQIDSFYSYCQFQPVQPLVAIAVPGNDLLWYSTDVGGVGSPTSPVVSSSVPGSFVFYVTQKRLFGCESLRKKVTVIIRPKPVASFNINDALQCMKGNNFLFTSTSTNLSSSTYSWAFGDGQTDVSGAAVSHAYVTYGTFSVTLKVVNGESCSSTKVISVQVNPNPVAAFTYPPIICEKQTPVQLTDLSSAPGNIDPLGSWWWQIGNNTSTLQQPLPFVPDTALTIKVKLVATSLSGCLSDTTSAEIGVHHRPNAAFSYSRPLCDNEIVRFTNLSSMPAGSGTESIAGWHWEIDRSATFTQRELSWNFGAGPHHVTLIAQSEYGCKSSPADSALIIRAKPHVGLKISDSCVFRSITYTALDTSSVVQKWYWNFNNSWVLGGAQMNHRYTSPGPRPFGLIGETAYGCRDTLYRPFSIYQNFASAGNDTIVAATNQPVQLNANGGQGYTYQWTPVTGLNDPSLGNPTATWDRDLVYNLYSRTAEGCESRSWISIKRFRGPELYVASAFTPNGDRINDFATVFPVGISKFGYFAIYDRAGQLLFRTTDPTKGWDGTFRGKEVPASAVVYLAVAIDYNGHEIIRKGSIVLIR